MHAYTHAYTHAYAHVHTADWGHLFQPHLYRLIIVDGRPLQLQLLELMPSSQQHCLEHCRALIASPSTR